MSKIIKGLTKETNIRRVNPVPPVVVRQNVKTEPKQNVYDPSAKKQKPEQDKKPVDVNNSSINLIAEKKKKPKPTSPDKWARAKAKARSKFDVYPSAYANAYASKEYKKMGGGWRMGESYAMILNYLKENRSDILVKFDFNQIFTAINENINENKINLRSVIAGLEMGHYDHLNEDNVDEGSRYYDPMGDERREQDAMDQERRDFKRREMEYELRNEPKNNYAVYIDGRQWKVFGDKQQAENIARSLVRKGKKATVHITGAGISEEQAPMFTAEDEQLDELKCWPGYTRVRGVPAGAVGSCKKKTKESGIMKGIRKT